MGLSLIVLFLFNVSYKPLHIVPSNKTILPVLTCTVLRSIVNITVINISVRIIVRWSFIFSFKSKLEKIIAQKGIIVVINVPVDKYVVLNPIT